MKSEQIAEGLTEITQADYEALADAVACDDSHSIRAQAIRGGRNATGIVAYEALRALATQRLKHESEIRSLRARLDAAEGRVRIAVWNDARGRGLTDEAAYSLINEAIEAIRDGEKN